MSACERRTRGLRSFPNGLEVARQTGLSPDLRAPGPCSPPGEDGGTLPSCRDGLIRKTAPMGCGAHTPAQAPSATLRACVSPAEPRGQQARGEAGDFSLLSSEVQGVTLRKVSVPGPSSTQTPELPCLVSPGVTPLTSGARCLPVSLHDQMLGVWKQSLAISPSA